MTDTKRPTAKDFQDVLLMVLGNLTSRRTAAPCKETYQPICEIKGITLDQFGLVTPGSKQTWVERTIQEAFKALVRKGYGERKSKGSWGLTVAGMARAEELKADEGVITPMGNADTVVESSPEIFQAPVGKVVYHEDPYIQEVAANNTPCFGKSRTKGGDCDTCPLERECLNALSTNLIVFARQLAADDAVRAQAALPPPPAATPPAKPAVTPPAKPAATIPAGSGKIKLPEGHVEIQVPAKGICVTCGQEIPKGEKVIWVRGDKAGKAPGMYHLTCYSK